MNAAQHLRCTAIKPSRAVKGSLAVEIMGTTEFVFSQETQHLHPSYFPLLFPFLHHPKWSLTSAWPEPAISMASKRSSPTMSATLS